MNKSITEIQQNDLVRVLKDNWQNKSDTRFVFLLGAGSSVQSGIESANSLSQKWNNEIKEDLIVKDYDRWKESKVIDETNLSNSYTEIFKKRFENNPTNGYEYLQKLMEDKEPSIGYTILSQILEQTNHNFVITTNFDSLIEDALFLFTSKRPLVCGHESLASFIQMNSTRPTIIKVHRDILLDPYNTPDNTCNLDTSFQNALNPILANSPIIVIGYGGNDKSIMKLLSTKQRQIIYWCVRNTSNISPSIKDILEEKDRIVKIDGFDEFMLALHSKVYDFKSIKSLSNENDNESLIVKNALKKVQTYKKQLDAFREEVKESSSDDFKENSKSIMPEWWDLQLEIEKEKDLELKNKMYKEALKKLPKSLELLIGWGNNLNELANINNDYEYFFNQAIKKFEKALSINSNYSFAYYSWGYTLFELGKKRKNNITLFRQAEEKFKIAIKLGGYRYNLACLYIMENRKNDALELLNEALKRKEVESKSVLKDEDWKEYLEDEDFIKIINNFQDKPINL